MFEVIVMVVWLVPLGLCAMMALGCLRCLRIPRDQTERMILQITTVGNPATVNEIIRILRGFELAMPHSIWVVTEPSADAAAYHGADRLLIVPREFSCRASYKARALEWTRRLRSSEGLADSRTKILFVDDDTIPSKGFIEAAFRADFDVCEGIVRPSRGYGHVVSKLDDMRFLNCLMFCSFFQGVLRTPLWVHGEGLCIRASAEQTVTWDFPVIASEDLVFGQRARDLRLRWGFVLRTIEITSPWTLRAFQIQRRRWAWGNVHAVRSVLSPRARTMIATKYLSGLVIFFVSLIAIPLDFLGFFDLPFTLRALSYLSLTVWLGCFVGAGFACSHGRVSQALFSGLLAWITASANVLVILTSLAMGNPRRFEVIEKERKPRAKALHAPASGDGSLLRGPLLRESDAGLT